MIAAQGCESLNGANRESSMGRIGSGVFCCHLGYYKITTFPPVYCQSLMSFRVSRHGKSPAVTEN